MVLINLNVSLAHNVQFKINNYKYYSLCAAVGFAIKTGDKVGKDFVVSLFLNNTRPLYFFFLLLLLLSTISR